MTSIVHALLSSVIDYAGLFPPAKLGMDETVRNYASYRESTDAWMLGRLIVPLARLDEFETIADSLSGRWPLSVIGQSSLEEDLEQIAQFNNRRSDSHDMQILSLERKLTPTTDVAGDTDHEHIATEVFLEIGADDRVAAEQVAATGLMAKIRTGGVESNAFPTVDQLAMFVNTCSDLDLTFKATAGLHHPFRSSRPTTHDPESPIADMHGFLNLFVAAAMRYAGAISSEQVAQVIGEREAGTFTFQDDSVCWQDISIDIEQAKIARQRSIRSFGSCSFIEPIDDLRALGVLSG